MNEPRLGFGVLEHILDAYQRGRSLALRARQAERRSQVVNARRARRWAERALYELAEAFDLLQDGVRHGQIGRETARVLNQLIAEYEVMAEDVKAQIPTDPEPTASPSAAAWLVQTYGPDNPQADKILRRLMG